MFRRYLFVVISPTDENFLVTIPSLVQAGGRGSYKVFCPLALGHYVMMRNETNNETLIKVPKPKLFQPENFCSLRDGERI